MPKEKKQLISIIVPCYNEEEALPLFYDEVSKVLKAVKYNYELILVNDGSKDNTLKIMESLSKKDKHVLYFSFSRNFGKESAMYAGLNNASGDYVAFMDADMQDPPALLPKMLEILQDEKYDSVATRRVTREGESKVRSFFAKMFYKIINAISDADIVDGARDFRLMKRPMVDAILSMSEYNRFSKGIFGWVGFNTYWLAFENVERVAGSTSWSFIKLFKYAIDGMVCFSNTPLIISIFVGVIFVLIAILYLIISLISGNYSMIIFLILFVGGIQLIMIGIVGEYIGKIFAEVKNRPKYIISKTNKKDSTLIK